MELPGDLWDRARAYEATVESACWWYPHRDFVIVSERPTAIHRELVDSKRPRGPGSHRLHCDNGPACGFRDGWGVWAWHGVRVPQYVVEQPDEITVAKISAEPNAEVRRVMMERYGIGRFLLDSKAKVLDSAVQRMLPGEPERVNELLELPLPKDDPERVLKALRVIDPSTSREYFLRVPPDQTTVRGALAWTFGLSGNEYHPVAET